jgi:hypothetical protein
MAHTSLEKKDENPDERASRRSCRFAHHIPTPNEQLELFVA